jgi:hypothetical protein
MAPAEFLACSKLAVWSEHVQGSVRELPGGPACLVCWLCDVNHPQCVSQEHICEVLGLPLNTKIKYNNHNMNKKSSNANSPMTSPAVARYVALIVF